MRTLFNSKTLIFVLPVLLTACAGGSFDTNIVPDYTPTVPDTDDKQPPNDPKPSDPEEPDSPQVAENHLGYQLAIPRRNVATYNEDGSRTELVDTTIIVDGELKEDKTYSGIERHLLLNKEDVQPRVGRDFELSQDAKTQGFEHISLGFEDFDPNPDMELEGREFEEHVMRRGPTGNLFYQGEQAAKAIPINPKVSYKGIWHYVTDAKQGRLGIKLGDNWVNGDEHGAISDYEDVQRPGGLASEFEVDFNNKKLTGKLDRIGRLDQEKTTRYTIDANIRNNRFSGNAKAVNKDDLYFHSDSNSVEGGFYGDKAQELAGSFMAKDNTAFVVFGAKSDDELSVEQAVDAFKINIDDYEDFAKSDIESFHDISKLVIDGKEIPLAQAYTEKTVTLDSGDTIEVRANKLDYTVFGYFNHTDTNGRYEKITAEIEKKKQEKLEQQQAREELEAQYVGYIKKKLLSTVEDIQGLLNNGQISKQAVQGLIAEGVLPESYEQSLNFDNSGNGNDDEVMVNSNIKVDSELFYTPFGKSLFIQGQRTPEKEMPQSLVIKYEGNWQGSFAKEGISPLNLAADNKAEFTVDFGDKSLTGRLSRNDDVNEHIDIDAKIMGSAFSGTAKTGEYGIYLDKANTLTGNQKVQFNEAKVEGGFYGPNAAELGGGLYSHEPKAAAVFGAKKIK